MTCNEFYNKNRIKKPLIRKKGKLKHVSWKEAYNFIYKNLKDIDSKGISFLAGSGSNEDAFVFQKFARETIKTENIDSCARICHAASAYTFNYSFGIKRMPSKIEDFEKADLILLTGTNPKVTYPIAFDYILRAKQNGAKLICLRDWKDESSKHSDLYIQIKDGTQIAFLNCILNLLIKNKKVNVPDSLKETVSHYDLKRTAKICNTKENKIKKAYKLISKSNNFVLGYGMGMTQHSYGTNNVFSAINLTLAKKGKIISMRGKSNIQGINDMGICTLNKGENIINSIFNKHVKCLWVMGMNPAQSLPNLNKVHKELKKMFIIYQGPFYNKTVEFADVVLPSSSFLEYERTTTSAESRVRYSDKIINKMYSSKENWRIINEISKLFDNKLKYKNIDEIWKDIKKIKGYNLHLNDLKSSKGKFVNDKLKYKKYVPIEFISIEGKTSKNYPFLLTTERWRYQFCTGERSSNSKTLNKLQKEPLCFINSKDAKKLKVSDNDMLLITSENGEIKIKAKIYDNFPEGLVSVPFHFEKCLVNKLFPVEEDPYSYNVNLKKIAVNIEKWY